MSKLRAIFGYAAIVLGTGTAIVTSGFTAAQTQQEQTTHWGRLPNNQWVNLSDRELDNSDTPETGTYSCQGSGFCSAEFEGTAMPSDPSQAIEDTQIDGVLSLND